MANQRTRGLADFQVSLDNLYREEVFTDMQAASLRRLVPVTPTGAPDPGRRPFFIGETTLMTQMGPLPVSFPLEADSLEEACRKFPDGVREAVEELDQRAREAAIDESSRIVVPTGMPPDLGGKPGGGKIIF